MRKWPMSTRFLVFALENEQGRLIDVLTVRPTDKLAKQVHIVVQNLTEDMQRDVRA